MQPKELPHDAADRSLPVGIKSDADRPFLNLTDAYVNRILKGHENAKKDVIEHHLNPCWQDFERRESADQKRRSKVVSLSLVTRRDEGSDNS